MKNLFSAISEHSFILTAAHSVLKHEPLKKKASHFPSLAHSDVNPVQ